MHSPVASISTRLMAACIAWAGGSAIAQAPGAKPHTPQGQPTTAEASLAAITEAFIPAGVADPTLTPAHLDSWTPRRIGPAGMSGRVAVVRGIPGDPRTLWVGAASGGLWKSNDAGLTFEAMFDEQPVQSIGALAIAASSHDDIWVGTGEANPRNSLSLGNGVYRSLDGGRTWKHLGLDQSEHIARIILDPSAPDTAIVAATGPTWSDHAMRGVFRTTDGGATWDPVLQVNERTGCADLEVDPTNPRKMFAAMWDHQRQPWSFQSGGEGSGLYRTLDGGTTWTKLGVDDGMPKGELGRIGLAIAPSNPAIVYALVEAKKSVLLRSDDGGHSFRTVNRDPGINSRPFYYCDLRVDPADPDRLYKLETVTQVSDDGGKSWNVLIPYNTIHPDHHALWIDPTDPQRLIDGNDGGVSMSFDRGKTWRYLRNLPLAQFYHINVDMDVPYNVYGGMQDNGSWRGPSAVWENGGIRNHHWQEVCFGDGFTTLPHPKDSMRGFAMSQEGHIVRWNLRTGERKDVRPVSADPEVDLRFNWNAALAIDPFRPGMLWFGSQFVHVSPDDGDSWEVRSDDLTTNRAAWQKQTESGGLTLDVTGAENFTSLVAIAPSTVQQGVVWVGSDDGRLHLTTDDGATWQSLEDRLEGVPANTWIPCIKPSTHDVNEAFLVCDNHRRGDNTPYAYRTSDGGQTWTRLAEDGVVRGYALSIEQDPVNPDLLFLGTEWGLYVSRDRGTSWMQWTSGFPHGASTMALKIHPREGDLVIGTHGRAAWILDDLTPLREFTDEVAAAPLHAFKPRAAIQHRVRQTGAPRFAGDDEFRGQTLARGVILSVWANQDELPLAEDADKNNAEAPDGDTSHEGAADEDSTDKDAPPTVTSNRGSDETGVKQSSGETKSNPGDPGSTPAKETPTPNTTKGGTGSNEGVASTSPANEGPVDEEEEPVVIGHIPAPDQDKPGRKATVEVRNQAGELVRTFETKLVRGLNRITWDLSLDGVQRPARDPKPRKHDDLPPRGALCLPGDYEITIHHGDRESKTTATVLADPREDISPADRVTKHRAVMQGQRLIGELATLTDRLARAKKDIVAIQDRLNASATPEEREAWKQAKLPPEVPEDEDPNGDRDLILPAAIEPRTHLHLTAKHALEEIQTLQDDIFGKEGMQGIVRRRSALDTTRSAASHAPGTSGRRSHRISGSVECFAGRVCHRRRGYAQRLGIVAAAKSGRRARRLLRRAKALDSDQTSMTEPKHDDAWQRAVLDLDEAEVKRLLATDPSLVNQPIVHYRGNGTTFQLSPIVKAGQSLTVTKLLVEAGADVNDCTSDGRALPLNGPGFEVGVYLIEHGADIDKFGYENLTPLAYAVYVGNQPLVEHLISRGAQLDRAHPAEGIAPLHYAARKSSAAMVRVLLTAGASPEAKDAQGKTPLDWAEAEGRDEAILALLR